MDADLQNLIDHVKTLADIRNLSPTNPVIVTIQQPVTAFSYTLVASQTEPSYLGIPLYVTWVVIDPASQFHLKALQLVSTDPPGAGHIPGFNQSWVELQSYAEVFGNPQYYDNGATGSPGPAGPAGPPGSQGPQGDPPTVDYDYIVQQVLAQLP